MVGLFYIKKQPKPNVGDDILSLCTFQDRELYAITLLDINECGIFGIPMKADFNVKDKIKIKSKNLFFQLEEESLKEFEKNIPSSKSRYLGLIE